jgi:hypothetical protein
VPEVSALAYSAASAAPAEAEPEVQIAEDVAKSGEDVLESAESVGDPARAQALFAVRIEQAAFFRVRQHFIGLRTPLEPLLGPFVVRISVRVVLKSQLAVRPLDVRIQPS